MLPPRPFSERIVIRSVLVWVFLRGFSSVGVVSDGVAFPEALVGPPVLGLLLAGVVVAVIRYDMARQAELVFLANLGHSFARIAALVAGVCAGLELALRSFVG